MTIEEPISIENQRQRLRTLREQLPEAHAVRLHRAISWMGCAEQQRENLDLRFISLWIAFNACYGVDEERHESLGERDLFQRFVHKLVKHDHDKKIYHCLWTQFSGPVRALIKNPYVFQPFWEAQRSGISKDTQSTRDARGAGSGVYAARSPGAIAAGEWQQRFDKSSTAAHNYLSRQQVPELLSVVLDRLYVLRNQLMHGGATYQSQVNRDQVRDGCNMLAVLMPILVDILLDATDEDWGEIYYPVVGAA